MLIVCWNVAGLSTTVTRINSSYGDSQTTNGKRKSTNRNSNAVLSQYMKRHNADIFCIQEHKIPLSQLSTRSEPLGCSDIEGYESFWSCCVDQKKKGLNGVVTYVRKDVVPIVRADSKPLGSPDLDDQGRCIMTDHGNFVLFNVYVPASSGQPLSYKMKFLNALRRAMKVQRTQRKKKVILVGDLNISHRPKDKYWADRVLFINDIQHDVAASADPSLLPGWKTQLVAAWPKIEAALESKKVVSTQTTNSLTNQKFDKYRMAVQVDGKQIFLGSHESHPGHCEYSYDFDSWHYICLDTGDRILAEERNVIRISVVAELLLKIAGIEWSESLQREIAATEGGTSRVSPPRRWLNTVMTEDGMMDAFEHFYPDAEGRYTCWNQFTNKRYVNDGARIDFTLVDASLAPLVRGGDVSALRCGCISVTDDAEKIPRHNSNTEAAALCAATANGRFRPVSFEGGGIIEATQAALDSQFSAPHTGIIYTPPSFSDHTAISLLMDDECCRRSEGELLFEEQDPTTRKAQPHKAQRSIASFFTAAASTSSEKAGATTSIVSAMAKERKTTNPEKTTNSGLKCGTDTATKRSKISSPRTSMSNAKIEKATKNKVPAKHSILNHFAPKKK